MIDNSPLTEAAIKDLIEEWPVVFKVCPQHKEEFFSDYSNAKTEIEGVCVICHPQKNDSLGG